MSGIGSAIGRDRVKQDRCALFSNSSRRMRPVLQMRAQRVNEFGHSVRQFYPAPQSR